MAKKKKTKIELDTETTIADMNIEGFKWYDPSKKNQSASSKKQEPIKLTPKERRAMIRGAFMAIGPVIAVVILAFVLVFAVALLWLK